MSAQKPTNWNPKLIETRDYVNTKHRTTKWMHSTIHRTHVSYGYNKIPYRSSNIILYYNTQYKKPTDNGIRSCVFSSNEVDTTDFDTAVRQRHLLSRTQNYNTISSSAIFNPHIVHLQHAGRGTKFLGPRRCRSFLINVRNPRIFFY
jgi:hypothetical protein